MTVKLAVIDDGMGTSKPRSFGLLGWLRLAVMGGESAGT